MNGYWSQFTIHFINFIFKNLIYILIKTEVNIFKTSFSDFYMHLPKLDNNTSNLVFKY